METLKISDLSVGDWVRYDDRICQIAEIYHLTYNIGSKKMTSFPRVTLYYEDDMPTYQESVILKDIRPIPITAEILEKNGFMRCSDKFSIYEYTTLLGKMLRTTQVCLTTPQSINVFLQDTTIERGLYHREKTSAHILRDELYIHDLQHALRLAGVDKEINLYTQNYGI